MSHLSYLETLLDGVEVEWKPLDDISVKISSGGTPKTGVAEFYDGDIPWLRTQEVNFDEIWDTGVKITEAGVDNSSAKWIPANCVIVAMYGATVGKIGINKIPMTTNQACANIQLDGNIANYRYVFHFLLSQYEYIKSLGSGSQTNINAGIVKKLLVPIPCPDNPEKSLAIQAEIVRILDAFTAMTAELTAELNMRKKQYNYYRGQLLSFEEGDVEWKTLGDLAENLDSKRKPITSGLREAGEIPYYGASGIVDYVKDYIFDGDYLLVSEDGANLLARNTPIAFSISGKTWVNNHAHVLKFETYAERKYVEYYLNSIDLTPYISGAAQPKLNKKNLESINIPNPAPKEKERIVAILDKFDSLTCSIKEGLPREIELRQKQYEYYRDLLLSFPASPAGGPKSDEAA
ncbi:type I restriction modification DNA specificity domain protein [Vibrio cholerae]|uniref:restriction endonuclease subunit S n=1 Tax=Vibrio cholerae TaxID=666 RepID=UPI0011D34E06|nr:restriction endonuclease subunit S [Vibrio cholerae]MEB5520924.1 restriction endonuclease subunit S [Vibrio cholerae]TXY18907.1 restriction endonuclease subunit S [Vibrio cholerae]GHY21231.1 type I restriction modification DNA specificity domain protein [Vibrio cholerae]